MKGARIFRYMFWLWGVTFCGYTLANQSLSAECFGAYREQNNDIYLIHGKSPRIINVTTGEAAKLSLGNTKGTLSISKDLSTSTPSHRTLKFNETCSGFEVIHADKRSIKTATRIEFDVKETSFASEGNQLAGRFIVPRNVKKPLAYVVLVHGSGKASGLDTFYHQYAYPAYGI